MCYQCGLKNHWSRVCQDSTRVVARYHSRREKLEIIFAQVENPKYTKMDLSDFRRHMLQWKIRFLDMGLYVGRIYHVGRISLYGRTPFILLVEQFYLFGLFVWCLF